MIADSSILSDIVESLPYAQGNLFAAIMKSLYERERLYVPCKATLFMKSKSLYRSFLTDTYPTNEPSLLFFIIAIY